MPERKKIAVILSRFPYPLDKGDKLRAYHQICYLAQQHDVTLFALSDEVILESHQQHLAEICTAIHIFPLSKSGILLQVMGSFLHKLPVQVGYFYSVSIKKKITKALHELKPDIVYCQLSRTALYAKGLPYFKVLDFQDAFSTNYERLYQTMSGMQKYFYKREGKLMKIFEARMLTWFEKSTIISEFDKQQIATQPNAIHVVPNGVDANFFKATKQIPSYDIMFSGNLAYLPNKQAVVYLVEKIFPLLKEVKPDCRLYIAGASGEHFFGYASKQIHIDGWVDDIRDAYGKAKIFVAPLVAGAGLQNKLLEAMSMGIPCISTSITNASLFGVDGIDLLLADNEHQFVHQIMRLLQDEELYQRLQANGRKFVETKYSWEQANAKLLKVLSP